MGNAVEVNGCNTDSQCRGTCTHFYGDPKGTGSLFPKPNGGCNLDGDMKCFAKTRADQKEIAERVYPSCLAAKKAGKPSGYTLLQHNLDKLWRRLDACDARDRQSRHF